MTTTANGLDNILDDDQWKKHPPTQKQLLWVQVYLGKEEVERIIAQGLNRGQVSELINAYIDQGFDICDEAHPWGADW